MVSMTELLYMQDSYLKEFEAKVVKVNKNKVILDKTAFYPKGGGLESDQGKIVWNDKEYKVLEVIKDKETGEVIHILDKEPEFKEGEKVKGIIDWERRYKLMRLHTAAHIISAILFNKYGAKVTGNHLNPEYGRIDFNLEREDWKEILQKVIEEANEIVEKGIEVKIYFLPREEAMKIPGIVKLASKLPPEVKELRIVEIPGVDIQADGGPHVKNTKEIRKIELIKTESKGRKYKRLYYTVK